MAVLGVRGAKKENQIKGQSQAAGDHLPVVLKNQANKIAIKVAFTLGKPVFQFPGFGGCWVALNTFFLPEDTESLLKTPSRQDVENDRSH